MLGTVLDGRYRLLEELGRGGMAVALALAPLVLDARLVPWKTKLAFVQRTNRFREL